MKKMFFTILLVGVSLGTRGFTYAEENTEEWVCDTMIGNFNTQQIKEMKAVREFFMKNKDVIAQKLKAEMPQSVIAHKIQNIIDGIDLAFCEKIKNSGRGYSQYSYFMNDIKELVNLFVKIKNNEAAFNKKTDAEAEQALIKLQNHLLTLVSLSKPLKGVVQEKQAFDLNFSFAHPEDQSTFGMNVKGTTDAVVDYATNQMGINIGIDSAINVTTPEQETIKANLKTNVDVLTLDDRYLKINEFVPSLTSTDSDIMEDVKSYQTLLAQQLEKIKGKYIHIENGESMNENGLNVISAIQTTPLFTFVHQEGGSSYGIVNPAWCAFNADERTKQYCIERYVDEMIETQGKGYIFLNKKGGQNYEAGITNKFITSDSRVDDVIEMDPQLINTPIMQRNDAGLTKVALPADAGNKNGLRYTTDGGLDIRYSDEMGQVSIKGPWTPTAINLKGDFAFTEYDEEKRSGTMSLQAENVNGKTKTDLKADVKNGTKEIFKGSLTSNGTVSQLTTSPLTKPTNTIPSEEVMGLFRGIMSIVD